MVWGKGNTFDFSCMARCIIACLAVLFFLLSCEKPPVDDVIRAEKALKEARDAGADRYAPVQFGKADEALAGARHLIRSKQYKEAAGSAKLAEGYARQAADHVPVAKEEYRKRSFAVLSGMDEKLAGSRQLPGKVRNRRTKKKAESLVDPFIAEWGARIELFREKVQNEEPLETYNTAEALRKDFEKELNALEASITGKKTRP